MERLIHELAVTLAVHTPLSYLAATLEVGSLLRASDEATARAWVERAARGEVSVRELSAVAEGLRLPVTYQPEQWMGARPGTRLGEGE